MIKHIHKDDIVYSMQEVNYVLNVERTGLRGFAAGGCIRDMYYGLPIKDVDILIPVGPGREDRDMFSLMERVAKEIRFYYDYSVAIAMAYNTGETMFTHESDFNERLYGVIQVQKEFPVDIIFSRCSNMREVVGSFDCNINAGWMTDKGRVQYEPVTELVWMKPVTDSRRERMLKKWEQICNTGM